MEPVSNADKLAEIRKRYADECKWAADPEDVRFLLSEIDREKKEWLEVIRREQSERTELFKAIQSIQQERDSLMRLTKDVSELISWRDQGNGKEEALKLIYGWITQNYPPQQSQVGVGEERT